MRSSRKDSSRKSQLDKELQKKSNKIHLTRNQSTWTVKNIKNTTVTLLSSSSPSPSPPPPPPPPSSPSTLSTFETFSKMIETKKSKEAFPSLSPSTSASASTSISKLIPTNKSNYKNSDTSIKLSLSKINIDPLKLNLLNPNETQPMNLNAPKIIENNISKSDILTDNSMPYIFTENQNVDKNQLNGTKRKEFEIVKENITNKEENKYLVEKLDSDSDENKTNKKCKTQTTTSSSVELKPWDYDMRVSIGLNSLNAFEINKIREKSKNEELKSSEVSSSSSNLEISSSSHSLKSPSVSPSPSISVSPSPSASASSSSSLASEDSQDSVIFLSNSPEKTSLEYSTNKRQIFEDTHQDHSYASFTSKRLINLISSTNNNDYTNPTSPMSSNMPEKKKFKSSDKTTDNTSFSISRGLLHTAKKIEMLEQSKFRSKIQTRSKADKLEISNLPNTRFTIVKEINDKCTKEKPKLNITKDKVNLQKSFVKIGPSSAPNSIEDLSLTIDPTSKSIMTVEKRQNIVNAIVSLNNLKYALDERFKGERNKTSVIQYATRAIIPFEENKDDNELTTKPIQTKKRERKTQSMEGKSKRKSYNPVYIPNTTNANTINSSVTKEHEKKEESSVNEQQQQHHSVIKVNSTKEQDQSNSLMPYSSNNNILSQYLKQNFMLNNVQNSFLAEHEMNRTNYGVFQNEPHVCLPSNIPLPVEKCLNSAIPSQNPQSLKLIHHPLFNQISTQVKSTQNPLTNNNMPFNFHLPPSQVIKFPFLNLQSKSKESVNPIVQSPNNQLLPVRNNTSYHHPSVINSNNMDIRTSYNEIEKYNIINYLKNILPANLINNNFLKLNKLADMILFFNIPYLYYQGEDFYKKLLYLFNLWASRNFQNLNKEELNIFYMGNSIQSNTNQIATYSNNMHFSQTENTTTTNNNNNINNKKNLTTLPNRDLQVYRNYYNYFPNQQQCGNYNNIPVNYNQTNVDGRLISTNQTQTSNNNLITKDLTIENTSNLSYSNPPIQNITNTNTNTKNKTSNKKTTSTTKTQKKTKSQTVVNYSDAQQQPIINNLQTYSNMAHNNPTSQNYSQPSSIMPYSYYPNYNQTSAQIQQTPSTSQHQLITNPTNNKTNTYLYPKNQRYVNYQQGQAQAYQNAQWYSQMASQMAYASGQYSNYHYPSMREQNNQMYNQSQYSQYLQPSNQHYYTQNNSNYYNYSQNGQNNNNNNNNNI